MRRCKALWLGRRAELAVPARGFPPGRHPSILHDPVLARGHGLADRHRQVSQMALVGYTAGVDDFRKTWPGNVPPPIAPPRRSRELALLLGAREIPLRRGEYLVGRAPSCEIVLDDMLASRAHAKITVTPEAAVVRDLGSVNGVFINGVRIGMPTPLRVNDNLRVGGTEMLVVTVAGANEPRAEEVPSPRRHPPPILINSSVDAAPQDDTLPGAREVVMVKQAVARAEHTEKADALLQLGRLADRMLAQGRLEDAVRAMSEQMRQVLEGARGGRDVPGTTLEAASRYAITFAEGGASGRWLDYVVELHLLQRRPLRAGVIDRFSAALRNRVPCDRDLFARYQTMLRKEERNMPLSERVLVTRICNLEPR